MRRVFLAVAVLGAAFVATPAPAATVTTQTSVGFNTGAWTPGVGGFNIMPCSQYREETVGQTPVTNAYCNVSVYDENFNGTSAFGQLPLEFDPLLLTGTIKGTIGMIVVDLTFVASRVSTDAAYAAVEAVPTSPQEANAYVGRALQGRVNGTVTSPQSGTIPAANAMAGAYRSDVVAVKA